MACGVCGDLDAKECSNCFTVSYCSKHCRNADWNRHLTVCKEYKGMQVLKDWRHVPDFAPEYK